MAFQLTAQDPFGQPVVGRDGVYVVAFSKKLPSENPSFESIKEKVTFDYQYSEALSLARKAGTDFDKTATNGLAQGKTFEADYYWAAVFGTSVARSGEITATGGVSRPV